MTELLDHYRLLGTMSKVWEIPYMNIFSVDGGKVLRSEELSTMICDRIFDTVQNVSKVSYTKIFRVELNTSPSLTQEFPFRKFS